MFRTIEVDLKAAQLVTSLMALNSEKICIDGTNKAFTEGLENAKNKMATDAIFYIRKGTDGLQHYSQ